MVSPVLPDDAAVVVEDNDPSGAVSYSGDWQTKYDNSFSGVGGPFHYTSTVGSFVQFTFTGTQVWYYSDTNVDQGNVEVSLDDGSPVRISSLSPTLVEQVALYTTPVAPGKHTLKITNIESKPFGVDYFAYLPLQSAQASDSSTGPMPTNPTAPGKGGSLSAGAAAGIAIAAVAILVALVLLFLWWRRKNSQRDQEVGSVHTAPTMAPTSSTGYAPTLVTSTYNPYSSDAQTYVESTRPTHLAHDGSSQPGTPSIPKPVNLPPGKLRVLSAESGVARAPSTSGPAQSSAPPAYES
ncbi:hypothetical protein BKA62DRAFT_773021 [Auriculariales sp. MPI-PUGE-AT-0066]|nr:hypothetical protein BKA62DRAFT_773021 [Auriculariales sp. MPI-PUGE-AT-0066]